MGFKRTPQQSREAQQRASRRGFMRRMATGAGVMGSTPLLLQGCGGGDDSASVSPAPAPAPAPAPTQASTPFLHGVASGDPLNDRVIIWTRVSPELAQAVKVDYTVASDAAMKTIVKQGSFSTDAGRDYTVKVDVQGLTPGSHYYYRFSALGHDSAIGHMRSLPLGAVDRMRIAVVSCSSLSHGYFNAYQRIAERKDLDFVLHLGDYIYEYGNGEYGAVRNYEPAHEIVSLADYRTRYAQYRREPELQALHAQHAMVAIWDDHEFTNNAYPDGAENHQPATEGDWGTRLKAAAQAYFEWMPIRVVDPAQPTRISRNFSFGNLVDLVLIDSRIEGRDVQLTPGSIKQDNPGFADASRSLLGAKQEQWMTATLRSSASAWRLLGCSVMMAQLRSIPGKPNASGANSYFFSDMWDGYSPARERLFSVLRGTSDQIPVKDVVVLSGDIHTSFVNELTSDSSNPDVAQGGYDPASGAGSLAVEFVGTSVTSPGFPDNYVAAVKSYNPHIKYMKGSQRGYMLIDVDAKRVHTEYWYVDTVASRSAQQSFGQAYEVMRGSRRAVTAGQL